ncbi:MULTISPECIES: alpha/beta fold hydrolase [Brachybacterium]|uniref:alpha/beta fold hydrolase n=1 Tax=Brachybacterium TaxID=43668 RepID=UPI003FD029D4
MNTSGQVSTSGPAPLPVLADGLLAVGDGHEIFWEESGNRDGVPVLYLHGGPGGRLSPGYRRSAPVDRARIIGLSQRGAGRSTPSAGDVGGTDLSANTTTHLVADLELLREHLGISAWIVEGVSWGSTLALAYAQAHPERVLGVVLFAVTSTSRREVDWITEGIGAVFPEGWDALATFAERHTSYRRGTGQRLVEAYRRLLTPSDSDAAPALVDAAAEAWMTWEDEHIRIGTGAVEISRPQEPADEQQCVERRAFARLVTHYWAHDGFVADWAVPWGAEPGSGLLGGMPRLAGIPGVLIHGRRDVSGPAITAWELHRAWPGSELVMIEDEGHGGLRMVEQWRAAMARLVAQNS